MGTGGPGSPKILSRMEAVSWRKENYNGEGRYVANFFRLQVFHKHGFWFFFLAVRVAAGRGRTQAMSWVHDPMEPLGKYAGADSSVLSWGF